MTVRVPRAVLAVLCGLGISVQAAKADGANGDYSDRDDLTEEVLSCEDAVAALASCCPNARADAFRCEDHRFRQTGCDGHVSEGHEHPQFNLTESQCIRDLSCDELRETGTCARAVARAERGDASVAADVAGGCL